MGVTWFWTEFDLHNGNSETSVSSYPKEKMPNTAVYVSARTTSSQVIPKNSNKQIYYEESTPDMCCLHRRFYKEPTYSAPSAKKNLLLPEAQRQMSTGPPIKLGPRHHTGDFTHSMPTTNHPLIIKIWFNLPGFGRAEAIDPI